MQMIILCGGLGTRLRQVIGEKQKTMADIAGEPFLYKIVKYYKTFGIKDFIFAVGYKKEEVENYFGSGEKFDIHIDYAVEEEPLGTGGAIRNSLKYIKEDYVYVVNGDTLYNADILSLKENSKDLNPDMVIMTKKIDDASRYGTIGYKDYNKDISIITSFNEKVETENTYINAGIYYIRKTLIQEIPDGTSSLEKDLLPQWLKEKKHIYMVKKEGKFIDIGTKETLNEIREENLPKQKVIFVDRDGTLCDDKGAFHAHIKDYDYLINNIELVNGVKESLKKLKNNGYLIIMISNQAGIAKGKFKERDVHKFNKRLNELLDNMIDGFYYCPHHDTGFEKDHKVLDESKLIKELIFDCDCRKPHIGLFIQAENDLKIGKIQYIDEDIMKSEEQYIKDRTKIYKKDIKPVLVDKQNSYMIGDKKDDSLSGKNYGVKAISVLTGEGSEDLKEGKLMLHTNTDYIVKDINEAVDLILKNDIT